MEIIFQNGSPTP